MPQGGRRKIPFSGKKKKEQLQQRNKTEATKMIIRRVNDESTDVSEDGHGSEAHPLVENIQKINLQPLRDPRSKSNRYVLQFHTESPKELKALKEEARTELKYKTEEDLELSDDFFTGYDFPKRPDWTYEMSKEQLEANENRYFFKYITYLEKKHYDDLKTLSYCELNIETWRQLWRVLELSDIVLIIVDSRFPTLMFPPSLFEYVTKELEKSVVIVLNKIDLVPSAVVLAWKKYFEEKYKNINVVLFTSCPSYNLRGKQENKQGLKIRRRKGRPKMAAEGAQQVFLACKEIVKDAVDLTSWEQKIADEINSVVSETDDDEEQEVEAAGTHEEEKQFDFEKHVMYKNNVVTIGCFGYPNVGKSSLLNALIGHKVASVSKTPGHTKHFQTIFLTNTVRLCDCPGLVFPSSTPRRLQVLIGSFPIAQLREPYASIRYLAERLDFPMILGLKHPEGEREKWSPFDICDAFAIKRGFITAKAARPDTYRAANSILRMALDGKLTLSMRPINFKKREEYWNTSPEIEEVKKIQALGKVDDKINDYDYFSDSGEGGANYQMKKIQRTKNDIKINEIESSSDDEEVPARANVSNPFDLLNDNE